MRKTFARQNDAADLWIAMQRDIFTSPPGPPIVRTLEHASFSLYVFGGFVGEHQTSSYRGHIPTKFFVMWWHILCEQSV